MQKWLVEYFNLASLGHAQADHQLEGGDLYVDLASATAAEKLAGFEAGLVSTYALPLHLQAGPALSGSLGPLPDLRLAPRLTAYTENVKILYAV